MRTQPLFLGDWVMKPFRDFIRWQQHEPITLDLFAAVPPSTLPSTIPAVPDAPADSLVTKASHWPIGLQIHIGHTGWLL